MSLDSSVSNLIQKSASASKKSKMSKVTGNSFHKEMAKICQNVGDDPEDVEDAGMAVFDAVMDKYEKINTAHNNFGEIRKLVQKRFHPFLKLCDDDMEARNEATYANVRHAHMSVKVIELAWYKYQFCNLNLQNPTQALIYCIASLGRRLTELVSGNFTLLDAKHFEFTGQLKTKQVDLVYPILILFDSDKTQEALYTIQNSAKEGETRQKYQRRVGNNANRILKNLFNGDNWFTIHKLRHIYCNSAYRCDTVFHTLSFNEYARISMGHADCSTTHTYQDVRVIFPGEKFMVDLDSLGDSEADGKRKREEAFGDNEESIEDMKAELALVKKHIARLTEYEVKLETYFETERQIEEAEEGEESEEDEDPNGYYAERRRKYAEGCRKEERGEVPESLYELMRNMPKFESVEKRMSFIVDYMNA